MISKELAVLHAQNGRLLAALEHADVLVRKSAVLGTFMQLGVLAERLDEAYKEV